MKSYTDIEQSKNLTEILPLESADMFYDGVQDLYKEKVYNIPINGSSITVRTGHSITKKAIKANLLLPCWSLSALLHVINFPSLTQEKENEWEVCVFDHNNDDYIEITASNPVDACYEMIIKLKEQNLL